ncbi:MAG TPA: serine/threonine-protein kinase [Kofleriaceae bacterium]|jgi:serine/threonine-protein kinase|nr:serine/threonine-protein kinase [Kofleriaceae bacterium]
MLDTGVMIDGRYRVARVLGRGGMGTVVEARHVQLGTVVALKLLHDATEHATTRFFREARATAILRSDHVCRIYDVGTFDGVPYLAMERLEGADLGKLRRSRGRIPVREACDYVRQACQGLAEAHAAQIVHRDLKPSNLFLTARPDGTPLIKLLDFGIAKVPRQDDADLTGTNMVLGSPPYMSLEQLRASKSVDPRSDIWSLGVILFELVTGQRPFAGESIADVALTLAVAPIPRLPEGPEALDPVIARCLARDPAQRYQGVAELADALAPFVDPAATDGRTAAHAPGASHGVRPAREMRARIPDMPTVLLAGARGRRWHRHRHRSSRPSAVALVSFAICAACAVVWTGTTRNVGPVVGVPSPPPIAAPARVAAPPTPDAPDRGVVVAPQQTPDVAPDAQDAHDEVASGADPAPQRSEAAPGPPRHAPAWRPKRAPRSRPVRETVHEPGIAELSRTRI